MQPVTSALQETHVHLWRFNGGITVKDSNRLNHCVLVDRYNQPLGFQKSEYTPIQFLDHKTYQSHIKVMPGTNDRSLAGSVKVNALPVFQEATILQLTNIAWPQNLGTDNGFEVITAFPTGEGGSAGYVLLVIPQPNKLVLEIRDLRGHEFMLIKAYGESLISCFRLGSPSKAQVKVGGGRSEGGGVSYGC